MTISDQDILEQTDLIVGSRLCSQLASHSVVNVDYISVNNLNGTQLMLRYWVDL